MVIAEPPFSSMSALAIISWLVSAISSNCEERVQIGSAEILNTGMYEQLGD
jgi:hypothetical protein